MEKFYYNENQRYIIPTSDFGFKRLFGTEMNKDILIGFLNEVIADKVIVGLEYLGLCSMCIADARTARAS